MTTSSDVLSLKYETKAILRGGQSFNNDVRDSRDLLVMILSIYLLIISLGAVPSLSGPLKLMRLVGAVSFFLGALVLVDKAALEVFGVAPALSTGVCVTLPLFT